VFVLRMDEQEAETLAASRLKTRGDTADFAEALVRRGAAEVVVIARGADGSVMATREGRWFTKAADVPVRSKVGAGDSFLAAFTLSIARGRTLPRALQEGMAAERGGHDRGDGPCPRLGCPPAGRRLPGLSGLSVGRGLRQLSSS